MKKELLDVYFKFNHSFNATVKMSPVPFWRAIRHIHQLKVCPLRKWRTRRRVTILRVRQKQSHLEPSHDPDVTMKARCVVQIACNDKVFDASENCFDKTVSWGEKTFCLYNDVYVPRKKKPASAKVSGDGPPSLCVYVSKDLILASNRL